MQEISACCHHFISWSVFTFFSPRCQNLSIKGVLNMNNTSHTLKSLTVPTDPSHFDSQMFCSLLIDEVNDFKKNLCFIRRPHTAQKSWVRNKAANEKHNECTCMTWFCNLDLLWIHFLCLRSLLSCHSLYTFTPTTDFPSLWQVGLISYHTEKMHLSRSLTRSSSSLVFATFPCSFAVLG